VFVTRTRDEWEALLSTHDCCTSAVHTVEEALASAHVRERGLWTGLDEGAPAFRFPAHFSNARTRDGSAPALGADTHDVASRDERIA
jgi:crotonobetainyl-CoA:carnitine CoA-transferase CaiB-like acyl-CoA transferase